MTDTLGWSRRSLAPKVGLSGGTGLSRPLRDQSIERIRGSRHKRPGFLGVIMAVYIGNTRSATVIGICSGLGERS